MAVLQANQVRAMVNLTDMDAAKDLKRQVDVSVPSGVTLVSVEPAKVDVVIPEPH
jgi:YbbR domain-containing protein